MVIKSDDSDVESSLCDFLNDPRLDEIEVYKEILRIEKGLIKGSDDLVGGHSSFEKLLEMTKESADFYCEGQYPENHLLNMPFDDLKLIMEKWLQFIENQDPE